MLVVYAPDERAEALALRLDPNCVPAAQAERDTLAAARALLLVSTDYYSRAMWQLKRWLTAHAAELEGKLCACLVQCAGGCGGELALRSLVSQLLEARCPVYLCAVAGPDGRIRPGGSAEPCDGGMAVPEYHTKLRQMAAKFG